MVENLFVVVVKMDIINSQKGPIKVEQNLKNILLEFTINCLLEQPEELVPYAADYFTELKEHPKTLIEREEVVEEEEEPAEEPVIEYTRGRAKVIYSEPYNPEKDTDDDVEDIIYEKTEEQHEVLYKVVKKCLLFRALDKEQIYRVIDVMIPKKVEAGDIVIKQYDDGDYFYVIEHGLFDVFIAEDPNSEPNYIFTYENTGSFGELALMYNMPRAATVKAKTEGMLWAMDRQTFRRIVLKAAFKKRKMYEELLSCVPMLENLTSYERMNLADALVPKTYKAGETIIAQGDTADGMYFIEDGLVRCTISTDGGKGDMEVSKLEKGGYFGELALITRNPRAANVVALLDTKVAFLDVEAFERILGPCMDIMQRNVDTYAEVRKTVMKQANL